MSRSHADPLRSFQASGMELVAINHAIFVYLDLAQKTPGGAKETKEVAAWLRDFQQRIVEQIEPERDRIGVFSEEWGFSKRKRKMT